VNCARRLAFLGRSILIDVARLCRDPVRRFQFAVDRAGIETAERTAVGLLLGLIVLLAAIWQAVGLGIARVHMIVKGIDLER
jgi:hypothetical protein